MTEFLSAEDRSRYIVDSQSCVRCGASAETTLDFDILGDLEMLAVCVICLPDVEAEVERDLILSGKIGVANTFGYGGKGRA